MIWFSCYEQFVQPKHFQNENFNNLWSNVLYTLKFKKDPAINYQLCFDKVDRNYLTEEELNTLVKANLEKQTHQIARDIFVFSCYTGLAYGDVYALNQENIVLGIDGKKRISTKREKTVQKYEYLYWI